MMKKDKKKLLSLDGPLLPIYSLLLAILISAVIMVLCGYNPISAYTAIFVGAFGSLRGIAQSLMRATPLIFTGLAFSFAKKASLTNLGLEGQLYMGALGSVLVGMMPLNLPSPLHIMLALVAGFVAGAAYAAIIGGMKVFFGASEVVAGCMLNTVATLLVGYLTNGPLLAEGSSSSQTERVVEAAYLPRIFPSYQLTIAIFVAVIACIVIHLFLKHTVVGYEIRSVGMNAKAAETAGISIRKITIIAICISGGIAGLAGGSHVLGVDRRLMSGFSAGYGFEGISVAALASDHPLAVILAGLIFGILKAGAMEVNRSTGIPTEFVDVIQAMVVLLVSAPLLVKELQRIKIQRKQEAGEEM